MELHRHRQRSNYHQSVVRYGHSKVRLKFVALGVNPATKVGTVPDGALKFERRSMAPPTIQAGDRVRPGCRQTNDKGGALAGMLRLRSIRMFGRAGPVSSAGNC
jgi:hypothetical protein